MICKFIIERNNYLKVKAIGYFHKRYIGFKQPGNPDFLNTLKNTFNDEPYKNLKEARDKVVNILKENLPKIIEKQNMTNCMLVCVPRAKAENYYSKCQLMFKEAVQIAASIVSGVIDGTDCIERVKNTYTTHIKKPISIPNDGEKPYPGIAVDTCVINRGKIKDQNIILIDDIYTKTVNIDEDCIQALRDNGARKVIFDSIGYTWGRK